MRGDQRVILAMGLVVAAVGVGLASLDERVQHAVVDFFGYGGRHSDNEIGMRHLFHSGANISGVKNGETYAQFDARRDRSSSDGFNGFGCVGSCVELEAGYRWAQARTMKDPKQCAGATWSFVEGCIAYTTPEPFPRP